MLLDVLTHTMLIIRIFCEWKSPIYNCKFINENNVNGIPFPSTK